MWTVCECKRAIKIESTKCYMCVYLPYMVEIPRKLEAIVVLQYELWNMRLRGLFFINLCYCDYLCVLSSFSIFELPVFRCMHLSCIHVWLCKFFMLTLTYCKLFLTWFLFSLHTILGYTHKMNFNEAWHFLANFLFGCITKC